MICNVYNYGSAVAVYDHYKPAVASRALLSCTANESPGLSIPVLVSSLCVHSQRISKPSPCKAQNPPKPTTNFPETLNPQKISGIWNPVPNIGCVLGWVISTVLRYLQSSTSLLAPLLFTCAWCLILLFFINAFSILRNQKLLLETRVTTKFLDTRLSSRQIARWAYQQP